MGIQNAGQGGKSGNSYRNQVYCFRENVQPDVDLLLMEWTYFFGRDGGVTEKEMLLRWLHHSNKDATFFIVDVGGKKDRKCMNNKLFDHYFESSGVNGMCLETALFNNGGYTGKKWGAKGDGLHTYPRFCENCSEDRKQSSSVCWQNWHVSII